MDKAAAELRAAAEARPNYEQAHTVLGSVLRQKGDLDAAQAELQAALKLDPQDAGAHQALGTVYQQKGNTTAASEEFSRSEEINKAKMNVQAATLATNTGANQLLEGDVDGAIEKFRAALKLAPDFAPAHFQLGMAFLRKGDNAQASAEFEKAHELDPHLRPPRVGQE